MSDRGGNLIRLTIILMASCFLWACEGDDGAAGAQGPQGERGEPGDQGEQGDPGSVAGLPIASAEFINVAITDIDAPADGSAPTISFTLKNDLNQGLTGLPADNISFVIAQLSPGVAGASSEWQSYVTRSSGGVPNAQASTEGGDDGDYVDVGDGSFTYTFENDLTAYPAGPTFDPQKIHRVGIEIRTERGTLALDYDIPHNNAPTDFRPPGIAVDATDPDHRLIVDTQTCNTCHDRLEFHGGARFDVEYCVMCHNPSSIDVDSGNTVDFKRLIHNIHSGRDGFQIIGFGGTVHDFSDVEWPQDIRNCQTCHEESDTDTPQASNYRLVPSRAACGTCHYDDGNPANDLDEPRTEFAIEDGVHPGGFNFNDDTQCVDCHGPNGTVTDAEGRLVQIPVAHEIRTLTAGNAFRFNVLDVTGTGPGETPAVTFSVTDPTNNNAPYNIHTDAPFIQCDRGASRLSVNVAWSTTDYTNTGSGFDGALPIQMNPLAACGGASTDNGDGTFTVTSPIAIPLTAVGSAAAAIEGHPAVDADNDGGLDRIAVTNAVDYAPITDITAVPRRNVVNITKCDDCHKQLSLHGNNRTDNPAVCVNCHNPNMTDARQRDAGDCLALLGPDDQTLDFKRMIHAIHQSGHDGSGREGVPFEVCGFRNSDHVFEVHYPGRLRNCEGCHTKDEDTFYPVDPAEVLGTTVDQGLDIASPTDDVVISPNTSVCSACHTGALAAEHMKQNGGDFEATKAADSSLISSGVETCALCHGPGRLADVAEVHGVGEFDFN